MKSVALLALAGLAAAQIDGLPTCAQTCATSFLNGGIGDCGKDVKCICSDKSFLSDIACCLAQPGGCDEADQTSAVAFASQLCSAYAVSVPSAVVCTATSTTSGTAAAATTSSAAATATSTGTASSGTTAAGASTAATASGTAATTGTTTGTTTSTTAAATTSSSSSSSPSATTSASKAWAPRPSAAAGAGLVGGIVAALAML